NPHPFRAGSSYLYLGGPPIEGAALLIEPGTDGDDGCTLLRPPPGPDDALWMGPSPSDAALAAAAGLAQARVVEPEMIELLLAGRAGTAVSPPCAATHAWLGSLRVPPASDADLLAIINLRLIKDEHELAAMRRAAEVTVEAHRAALGAAGPGRHEADIAAAYHAVLVARQCRPSFTPITTVRGETLHVQSYTNRLKNGDLLLIDAGAEEPGGYACDVTRTAPVGGEWNPTQRHLYDTVLRAQRETIAACVPGRRFREVHDLAARIICEGLVQAELLRGDPSELAARYAHTLFFCHGLGHLIGLDVHDMEDFGDLTGYAPGRSRRPEFGNKFLRLDRDLDTGMCVTIEPGVYFVPALWERQDLVGPFADVVNRPAVDALLAGNFGGIRIEETICVRESGQPEVLTEALPNDADAVAEMIGTRV
ncbi:MAG TPA: aminopeptidase P N-terminal domain-containing protein, partial [Phycisphaerae bacterium]|nr:aminopeptidase P N-terminal domain-containing protein [Phycisphaerae bacterium]